jgi:hypothetical protein
MNRCHLCWKVAYNVESESITGNIIWSQKWNDVMFSFTVAILKFPDMHRYLLRLFAESVPIRTNRTERTKLKAKETYGSQNVSDPTPRLYDELRVFFFFSPGRIERDQSLHLMSTSAMCEPESISWNGWLDWGVYIRCQIPRIQDHYSTRPRVYFVYIAAVWTWSTFCSRLMYKRRCRFS